MKVLSLFSGIGGFDLGLERAGMEVTGFAEIDPFGSKVLAHHWPGVPNYGDVRNVGLGPAQRDQQGQQNDGEADQSYAARAGHVDLICGGFPCQDLSVAGKRAGLSGERSGLWFEFHRIMSELRPSVALIENVPGLLSACGCDICTAIALRIWRHTRSRGLSHSCQCHTCNAGRSVQRAHAGIAFGIVLAGLEELWPGRWGWAVLDSQHFGVAQRRRRLYVIAGPRRERIAQILSLCEGGDWHSPKSREAREDVANPPGASATSFGGQRFDLDNETYVPSIVPTIDTRAGDSVGQGFEDRIIAHSLRAEGFDASEDGTGRGTPLTVIQDARGVRNKAQNGIGITEDADVMYTLDGTSQHAFQQAAAVRRLTPTECARLQGFPDDWLDLPGAADGPKYKALGNAVTVPVIEYIGKRIIEVLA